MGVNFMVITFDTSIYILHNVSQFSSDSRAVVQQPLFSCDFVVPSGLTIRHVVDQYKNVMTSLVADYEYYQYI